MKKTIITLGIMLTIGCSEVVSQEIKNNTNFTIYKTSYIKPLITREDAKKRIESYIKNTKYISSIKICEGNKYYIAEIYIKGYENFDVARKIYVDKISGDLYPTPSETFDYCYMVKK